MEYIFSIELPSGKKFSSKLWLGKDKVSQLTGIALNMARLYNAKKVAYKCSIDGVKISGSVCL